MSVHSALTHHMIEYAKIRAGDRVIGSLLSGIDLEISTLTSIRERVKYPVARRLVENFYEIFKGDELYLLGRDFVSYFTRGGKYNSVFPLISLMKVLPPMDEMDEQTFDIIIGIASNVNTVHNFELLKFTPGFAEIAVKRNPRFGSKSNYFKLSDEKYLEIICRNFVGMLEKGIELLRPENLKIVEKFHQGAKIEGVELPHCLYRIYWESQIDNRVSEIKVPYNLKKFPDLVADLEKKDLDFADIRILIFRAQGYTQKEIAGMVGRSVETIKKREKKMREAYKVKTTVELIYKFQKLGYFDALEAVGLKDKFAEIKITKKGKKQK